MVRARSLSLYLWPTPDEPDKGAGKISFLNGLSPVRQGKRSFAKECQQGLFLAPDPIVSASTKKRMANAIVAVGMMFSPLLWVE